jgi:hypothetical protein
MTMTINGSLARGLNILVLFDSSPPYGRRRFTPHEEVSIYFDAPLRD